jgi:3-phosphoshikimate 1-carboxyvinyltransferase
MKKHLTYTPDLNTHKIQINLPGSKSQSNRVLILCHQLGLDLTLIENLSESRDTSILKQSLLNLNSLKHEIEKTSDFFNWAHYNLHDHEVSQLNNHVSNQLSHESFDFMDAGTPARFILAYFSALGILTKLTGNSSLENRSMQPLVDVLESGGAKFEFHKKSGHFPIEITRPLNKFPNAQINRTMSSQYVSALMLIAPLFKGEKTIQLTGMEHSNSYIQMTQKVLADFGIDSKLDNNSIYIEDQQLQIPSTISIESDWSAATYFYSVCALIPQSEITINHLTSNSCQGDAACASFFEDLGVVSSFHEQGCTISNNGKTKQSIDWNLSNVPDLAPTLIVTAAALGIEGVIEGIENLKFKESNRIDVLNLNLQQFGYELSQKSESLDVFLLQKMQNFIPQKDQQIQIQTHSDHRIAMAFAPLAILKNIVFDDIQCVEKSFPNFWDELQKCNFELKSL